MKEQKRYDVGIYCRLSKDDMGGGESTSIVSQRNMLEKYVKENGWTVYDCYIDDGYSGTNFNRPDFERMIDDVEHEKINMVVVKDLSRLGRNYLMSGQYTEVYFPDRGVRFIALNDGIDTINTDNDIAPFKNILNEMYAKDISKKVRSAVRTKKQNGEFLSNRAPYGYQKDPINKNKLIIEETGAVVVGRIYDMCQGGFGTNTIAKTLNNEGILSPRNHHEVICPNYYKTPQRKYEWTPETIHGILRSRIYRGDMVQGIYECSRFKRTPNKRKPKNEWIITPNTHEPIIDSETWEYVQKCLDSRKRVMHSNELQLFAGFIKCADCGYALAYARRFGTEYYSCGLYRRRGIEYCTQHYINKEVLTEIVLDDIRKHARLAVEEEELLAKHLAEVYGNNNETQVKSLKSELKMTEKRHAELDKLIKHIYEDNVTGKITDKRFCKLSGEYELEQTALEVRIEEIQNELEQIGRNKHDYSSWLELIKNYTGIRELDRIVLSELVEKITVGNAEVIDGKKHVEVTIYYKFIGAIRL